MKAILSYIIAVINGLVDLLSVQLFPDFPVTVFQFMCSIVVICYIFKFIFGGTREFDNFANISIRDVSRSIKNDSRKVQIINNNFGSKLKSSEPYWLNHEVKVKKVSEKEKEKLRAELSEFM